jgi:hypothetical protein
VTEQPKRSGEWYLVVVALAADLIGIATFVGFSPSRELRLGVAGGLCIVGVIASGYGLLRLTLFWISPAGSYYAPAYYRLAFLKTGCPLLISVVLGLLFVAIAGEPTKPLPLNEPASTMSAQPTPSASRYGQGRPLAL